MKVRAQIGMVLNLDKCIGCHTCSVTCKNVWTSRPGVEYAWFNNVETKPGIGYPKEWENQGKWKGGWVVKRGKLNIPANQWNFLWVVDFPMFDWDEKSNRFNAIHHPFTAPSCSVEELIANPGAALSQDAFARLCALAREHPAGDLARGVDRQL